MIDYHVQTITITVPLEYAERFPFTGEHEDGPEAYGGAKHCIATYVELDAIGSGPVVAWGSADTYLGAVQPNRHGPIAWDDLPEALRQRLEATVFPKAREAAHRLCHTLVQSDRAAKARDDAARALADL